MSKFYGIYLRDSESTVGINSSEIVPFLFSTRDCALAFIDSLNEALDFIVGIESHEDVKFRFFVELITGTSDLSVTCNKKTLFVAISNNFNEESYEFLATGRTKKQCKESANRILTDESHEDFDFDKVGASVAKVSTEFLKSKKLTTAIAFKLARVYVKSRFDCFM